MSASSMFAPTAAASVDPRAIFQQAIASAGLRRILLAGAKALPADRSNGIHLGDPLFSQWPIARDQDGWSLRIHCFHRDDPDPPHNHAWRWWSLILETGYWDCSPTTGRRWRGVGDLVEDDGTRFHHIELGAFPAWTLFLRGPQERNDWGFLLPDGRILPYDQFTAWRTEQTIAVGAAP